MTRLIPFAALADVNADAIDDAREVYRDHDTDQFGHIIVPCKQSPSGQCEYWSRDNFKACIWCKTESQVW